MDHINPTHPDAASLTPHPDYPAELVGIVRSGLTPKLMQTRILVYHEKDVAAALAQLRPDERSRLFGLLPPENLVWVLEYTDPQDGYLTEIPLRRRAAALSRMDAAIAVEHLQTLDRQARDLLLDLLDEEARREISLLDSFDDDEIGSWMTTNFIAVKEGLSIREAMRSLIAQAAEHDNISTIYVTDSEGMLVGAIDLKDLIIARETAALSDITVTAYPYVYAAERIEDCIERLKTYSEDSIPVLDAENRLKGVLTSQDLMQLSDDELGDDYAKLAGLSAEEDLREPLRRSIGKRLPWLIVLLGLGLLVSGVVGAFEQVVAHLAVIVSFQSLILGMAGNTGTQSLAVTIRVLMDEQLTARQKLYLVGKEARVGLTNGCILGLLSFGIIGLYLVLFRRQAAPFAFAVSACTGIALAISILLSSIAGTVIPLIFKKVKIDPAVASGPLITTVNDLVAIVTYYGLAWLLLINLLHL